MSRATQFFESSSLLVLRRAPKEQVAPLVQPSVRIPACTDLVGYEALVEFIRREGADQLPGDFLEIGCFLGGGTAKLARLAQATGKRVWVIDVFDPGFDVTANASGSQMADLYEEFLCGCTQAEVFASVTRP